MPSRRRSGNGRRQGRDRCRVPRNDGVREVGGSELDAYSYGSRDWERATALSTQTAREEGARESTVCSKSGGCQH